MAEQNHVLTNSGGGRQEEYSKGLGIATVVEMFNPHAPSFGDHLKNVNAQFSSHL